MKAFNHILCPYDFSDFSEKALEYSIQLAGCSDSKLTVMHVLVNPFLFEGGNPLLTSNILAQDLLEKIRSEERAKLDELKQKISSDHPQLNIDMLVAEENDIGEAVLHVQQRIGADVVVIGSHGRKGLKRVFLGSVAEAILRDAKCPVLIVK